MFEKKSDFSVDVEAGKLIKASAVRRTNNVIYLHVPGEKLPGGHLTITKENGAIKGFEYHCVCGHTDAFLCE